MSPRQNRSINTNVNAISSTLFKIAAVIKAVCAFFLSSIFLSFLSLAELLLSFNSELNKNKSQISIPFHEVCDPP